MFFNKGALVTVPFTACLFLAGLAIWRKLHATWTSSATDHLGVGTRLLTTTGQAVRALAIAGFGWSFALAAEPVIFEHGTSLFFQMIIV
jgi:hypothetical protein